MVSLTGKVNLDTIKIMQNLAPVVNVFFVGKRKRLREEAYLRRIT